MSNYYDTLGLNKNCSQDDIKAAFRKLAREHHPDKGGDKEQFQKIQEAYETLSDPQKREQYDNPSPFGGQNPFEFNMNSFFNTHMQRSVSKKNNHVYICKITLRDLYYGIIKNIRVTKNIDCDNCNTICNLCGGHGNVSKRLQLGPLTQILQQPCIKCNGRGKINANHNNCNECKGKKSIQQEKIVEIKVERGSDSEQHIVVEGWGEQATKPNEISGDLIINVTVLENSDFSRQAGTLDLIHQVKITLKESIVGKIITIPHFDGQIALNINSFGIINPNKQYTIFNKGLVDKNNQKGHLHIRFEIEYPETKLNEEQITELMKMLTF